MTVSEGVVAAAEGCVEEGGETEGGLRGSGNVFAGV